MNTLQRLFEDSLQKAFSFPEVAVCFLEKKLAEKGISLTEEQRLDLRRRLTEVQDASLTFEISSEQAQKLLETGIIEDGGTVEIRFEEHELDGLVERFVADMPRLITEVASQSAEVLLEQLKKRAPEMLTERSQETSSFHRAIRETWGGALDLFEMFIVIAIELGSDFVDEFRPSAEAEQDLVFEVMARLGARACQVAQEIHHLLCGGFADGAHARWRSLHEIATVAALISSHDNELAERYLAHAGVESYKAARDHQQYCAFLHAEPMTSEEYAVLESNYQMLLAHYGNEFKGNYGWAASVLNNPNPSFADIERAVGFDRNRPFYRLASHNVHANPKGIFFKLGLFPGNEDLLLAGPSPAGFADPGHGAAISLGQTTTSLLTMRPNLDRIVACHLLLLLTNEVGTQFLEIQRTVA